MWADCQDFVVQLSDKQTLKGFRAGLQVENQAHVWI